jgi:hypothetical protein
VGSGGDATLRATPAEPVRAGPVDVPQAAPALFGPERCQDRGTVPGSTIVVGRRGEQGRFTNEATGVEQPPVVPDDTSRAFRNFTDPSWRRPPTRSPTSARRKAGSPLSKIRSPKASTKS